MIAPSPLSSPAPAGTVAPPRFAKGVSLETAIQCLLQAKQAGGLRTSYLKVLRCNLRQFSEGRQQTPVADLDVNLIEQWCAEHYGGNLESRKTMQYRLSALFSFCERRGWIDRNPCRMMERIRIDRKPPRIVTPEQADILVAKARSITPRRFAYLVLALYCGVRPQEIERVGWDSVHLDRGIVIIDAAASKVRRRRIIELHPKAARLLAEAKQLGATLPVGAIGRRRFLHRAMTWLDWPEWPKDCLRHSAASYMLALNRDPGKVSLWLGNSPGILMRHYVELVDAETCARFWA